MNTSQLTVELPISISNDDAQLMLALKLFETGKASLGQAAKLSGYSKQAFIEILGKHKIPVVNYSPEELREELGL
ncbi:MAG TPA: UPF0175 family protein [Planctomycetota bacterium]|nr:UPF0175 family protein [Planctomycetota bacterium]